MKEKVLGVLGLSMMVVGLSVVGSLVMYHFKEFTWPGFLVLSLCLALFLSSMVGFGQKLVHGGWSAWLAVLAIASGVGVVLGTHLAFGVVGGPLQLPLDLWVWVACCCPYIVGLSMMAALSREIFRSLEYQEVSI